MWDQWAIFYISGHKSQSLASKDPKFSMNNNLSLYPHIKISRIFSESGWKFYVKKFFFRLIGSTCVGSMNHLWGDFEPPLKILSYLGAIQRILPKIDFSIVQHFSLQHNLHNVAICNERM